MGNDVGEVDQLSQRSSGKKVLGSLYREISKIMEMILPIIPIIESARPGGTSGIYELCLLNSEIEKLRLLLQNLTESSSFYLAMTGDAVILRCERRRNALHESLSRILTMVPDPLAGQVVEIVPKLRSAKFSIDSCVEEAGRGVLSVLQQSNPSEDAEFGAFCNAALKLEIISPRARLLEKRCIKKLLEKFRGSDPQKETALKYLLYLFRKYEKRLVSEKLGQKMDDRSDAASGAAIASDLDGNSAEIKGKEAARINNSVAVEPKNDPSANSPPKEFLCPLSLELMRDPVVIASGETYERAAIAKWFRDGNDICPRTGKKMTNLAMVPNSCMKTLISSWCEKRGIRTLDPAAPRPDEFQDLNSWNSLTSCSIASLNIMPAANVRGRMADYDCSNVSILSTDAGYLSDSSYFPQILPDIDESGNGQASSSSTFSQDSYEKFFSDLSDLSAESQAKALADLRSRLRNEGERRSLLSGGFMDALVRFLKESYHLSRVKSQKIGSQMLLAFLDETRPESPRISEEAYELLLSFLDSEITREALMILQIISGNPSCVPGIALLGIRPLLKTLDSGSPEFLNLVLEILGNLSSSIDGKLQILSLANFSKLLQHLSDGNLSGNCVKLLHSLCAVEEGKKAIAETEGCVTAIAGLLDSSDREEQAHAVAILLALCSSCSEYCSLVMKEGIVPPLVHISINGSSQGRESSKKLLYVLRDFREEDQEQDQEQNRVESFLSREEAPCLEQQPQSMIVEKKRSADRKPGFFRKMFQSKHNRSLALF